MTETLGIVLIVLITLLLLAVALGIITFLTGKDKAKFKDSIITLTVSVIGTFLGVYLAVALGQLRDRQLERAQLKATLNMAILEISSQYSSIERGTKEPNTAQFLKDLDKHPATRLASVDALLSNPLLAKYGRMMYPALNTWHIHLIDDIQKFRAPSEDSALRMIYIRGYLSDLKTMGRIVEAGYKYVDGKIDDSDYLDEFGEIMKVEDEKQ